MAQRNVNNISRLFGVPSTRDGGIEQHKKLREKLKNNGVYSFPSMNRGYLVLRHEKTIGQRGKEHKIDIYPNYLQKSKPTGTFIMVSKV